MTFQPIQPLGEHPTEVDDLHQRVPDVCTAGHLAALLTVTEGQIRRLYREGKLDTLILKPQIGRTVRFSGLKVRAWIAGEDVTGTTRRVFGQRRA